MALGVRLEDGAEVDCELLVGVVETQRRVESV